MQIRCPQCHVPFDSIDDSTWAEIVCPSCGSQCNLTGDRDATRTYRQGARVLGHFELLERVGIGRFGAVWKARDTQLQRIVAIKIPRQRDIDAQQADVFFRDARAAAQLKHPRIASVHEVGREDDTIYIVSDFIDGANLKEWLTGQRLTSRESAEMVVQIAEALEHAHQAGVVHRDLKPGNIMVDRQGQPHVIDFGLARRETGEATMTVEGQVLGTPAYMSPEQARGEGHRADGRSDIYSLGVILFELLTGELPFRGEARMLIVQILDEEPPSPRKLNANIARDIETITLKCLDKDPAKRYQTAQELGDDLRRFLQGEPVKARLAGRLERVWRWARRNPTVAALSALLLTVLTSVSIVAPIIAVRQGSLREKAEIAEKDSKRSETRALAEAARASREARRADEQARLAKDEAEASKRLVKYVGSQYALSQGHVRDAYQQIEAALSSKPQWEYGRLLDSIVSNARQEWRPSARLKSEQPIEFGCYAGPGPKWLVVVGGGTLRAYAFDGTEIGRREKPQGGTWIVPVGKDRIAMAVSGSATIFSLPDLKVLHECKMPDDVVGMQASGAGDRVAVLDKKAVARIFDDQGRQLAERKFDAPQSTTFHPKIDLSLTGDVALYDPGLWTQDKVLWKWETDNVEPFELQAHSVRLCSSNLVVGLWSSSTGGTDTQLKWVDFKDGSKRVADLTSVHYAANMRLEGAAYSNGAARMALVSEEMINAFDAIKIPGVELTSDQSQGASRLRFTRLASLWPHAVEEPKFLAFDAATQGLALIVGQEVVLFDKTPVNAALSGIRPVSYWSMAATGDRAWTVERFIHQRKEFQFETGFNLHCYDLKTDLSTTHVINWPKTAPDRGVIAWGVARGVIAWGVAGDRQNRRVAVLWQENDGNGNIGATYFRKFARVYELSPAKEVGRAETLRLVRDIELKEFEGVDGRMNRELLISPDGEICAFCAVGKCVGYKVATGEPAFTIELNSRATLAFSNDPPMLATGRFDQADAFRVFDLTNGKEVFRVKLDASVRRAVVAAQGTLAYVGLNTNRLRCYRIGDGRLVSEIATSVAPTAVSSSGDRFLGFIPDGASGTQGGMVLADLKDGHVIELLNPAAHVLNHGYFSDDGASLIYLINRESARFSRSIDIKEAKRRLERMYPANGAAQDTPGD